MFDTISIEEKRLLKKSILITGAAGFVGAALTIKLLEKGEKIIAIDNMNSYYDKTIKFDRLKRIKDVANKSEIKNFEFYECSIEDMIDFDTNYTPTQIESIDYFINKEKHNNDYYVINELEKLYLNDNFFGNYDNLIFNGLPMHYNLLKKYVFENNLIGMILYGADIKSELNIIINTIFLLDNDDDGIDSVFNLTIKSISNTDRSIVR